MLRCLAYIFVLLSVQTSSKTSYKGWQLYRFWPPEYLVKDLSSLYQRNMENFDFWSIIGEPNVAVDLAVKKNSRPSFQELVETLNLTHEIQIEHIDKAFNRERKEMKNAPDPEQGKINFAKYHRYKVITRYLKGLTEEYGDIVSLETIGQSVEGRDIVVVKISSGRDSLKPAVLINAALSPREWIGPAQALYIIQELVENPNNKEMIENLDWYIIPIVNPDGYEFTHSKDRLWKKNRSQNQHHYGIHLNFNFDINFEREHTNSSNAGLWCYPGSKPFSEPETQSLKRFIEDNASQIKLYLNLHSFGPAIVYPYGYTDDLPENTKNIKFCAEKVAEEIQKKTQTPYQAKHAASRHKLSGSVVDWAMKKAGIPYAYTIELPSPGFLGFDFPVHMIEGVVKQFMVGLGVFHDLIRNDFVIGPESDGPTKDEL